MQRQGSDDEELQEEEAPADGSVLPESLATSSAALSGVIQGVFLRAPIEAMADEVEVFVDQDSGKRYTVVAYHGDKQVTVREEDGKAEIRLESQPNDTWTSVAMDTERMDTEMMEEVDSEEDDNGPFNSGLDFAAARKSQRGGPSMTTNLTAQVTVVPIANGDVKEIGGLKDVVYTAGQIWVEDLRLGDNDRPETRYGRRQERHTVAWTLQRAAQMALSHRPLSDVLQHYIRSMRNLDPEEQSPNCKLLINSVLISAESLIGASLPVDVWQQMISRVVVLYLQAYQQAGSSTFKQGKAVGHNEGGHMATLRGAEEALATGGTVADGEKVVNAATGLLDGGFYTALGPEGYAKAIFHWLESLRLAFPFLMTAHEDAIRSEVYRRPLPKGVQKNFPGLANSTVGALVAFLSNSPDVSALQERRPLVQGGSGEMVLSVPPSLASDFTANARVLPAAQGKETKVATQIQGQDTFQVSQPDYAASEVTLAQIQVSDRDRPDTRFDSQMSHTVAWTLLRAELASFAGHPTDEVLAVLAARFARFAADLDNQEAVELTQASTLQCMYLMGARLPIHRWQAAVSDLFRRFAIIYQKTGAATFADDTTHGQALGHGEAAAMARLVANENAFLDDGKLADGGAEVIKAALTLFDGHVNKTLSAPALVAAILHWYESLERVFPNVMKVIAGGLRDHLASQGIGAELQAIYGVKNLLELVEKLKPQVEAGIKPADSAARDGSDVAHVIADPLVSPDGGILPAAQARFILAYRNDVRMSNAYLTEGEGHLVASSMGFSVDIQRGAVPLSWEETNNPGGGDCLIHALVAGREAAAGRPPRNATPEEIAAARNAIADGMADDEILALCAAAVFGVFLGAPEAGLGPNMRTLLAAPSIVQARIAFKPAHDSGSGKDKEGSPPSSGSGGGGVQAQGGVTIGAGPLLPDIRIRHNGGAHYTMIRRQ